MNVLTNSAIDYARVKSLDSDSAVNKARQRISSTMSDRAIVNAKTVRLLEVSLDKSLVMLNCNVYPLDSVAITFRRVLLHDYEKTSNIPKRLFGSESTAVNVVQNLCKLHFKQG